MSDPEGFTPFDPEAAAVPDLNPVFSAIWQHRFMTLAREVATWSKDPSSQVGAVIVSPDRRSIATGYNGFPRGMQDDDRLHDREQKYPRVIHAELNALLNTRFDVAGAHMFVTLSPCQPCASAIIQMQIGYVYAPSVDPSHRWARQQSEASEDMGACGVRVVPF